MPDSLIPLIAPTVAVIVGVVLERILHRQNKKIAEIHVLVNDRLDEALAANAVLRRIVLKQANGAPLTPASRALVDELRQSNDDLPNLG